MKTQILVLGTLAAVSIGLNSGPRVREALFGDQPKPAADDDLELVHLFEIVRHGARAPLLGGAAFNVSEEQLTPMGMRQRYLLGRHNWNKYGSLFYDEEEGANVLNVSSIHSTMYYRTMQSGYSELLGFMEEHLKQGGRPYLSQA